MVTKTTMESVKRCEVIFWTSSILAFLLLTFGKWYSAAEGADQGYSVSDTFLLVGLMSFAVTVNCGHWAIRYLKQEILDPISGPDDSPTNQDCE